MKQISNRFGLISLIFRVIFIDISLINFCRKQLKAKMTSNDFRQSWEKFALFYFVGEFLKIFTCRRKFKTHFLSYPAVFDAVIEEKYDKNENELKKFVAICDAGVHMVISLMKIVRRLRII